MIELLSEHIYSSPNVFVRELLQNSVDAITARRSLDESFVGEINVYVNDKLSEIVFEDNGIGLSEDEVHKFLSVIGQSSKRDDILAKGYIGKFGIGLLSCFVVSNEIIVETRSLYKQHQGIRWKGKSDGTYTIEQINEETSPGTKIILCPKKEWKLLFEKEDIKKNILHFGEALPTQISLISNNEEEILVENLPVWLNPLSTKDELLQYGKDTFNITFIDVFRMSSKVGEIRGVGFIMPYKIQFTSSNEHRIYLKRMFLCEHAANLFPEWSSFVKCVINTNTLKPTASRESLMDNEELKMAKKELNFAFKQYLRVLSISDTNILSEIINTHHLYIKALAAEDTDLLRIFVDHIPFETNKGMINFDSLRTHNEEIFYTPSMDDFRQIRRIAGSQGKVVINAAYSFENDLIRKISIVYPNIRITKITPHDVLSNIGETVINDQKFKIFEERANKILKSNYCKAQIKKFEPEDTPAIYVADEEALNNKNISNLTCTSNPFAPTLHGFIKKKDEFTPTLCFNKDNTLINDLTDLDDETMFEAVINILYVQSLMLGNYPVNKKEMTIFNDSVYKLLIMGMSNFVQKLEL
jgi:molecular chaperone HtpG